MPLVSLCKDGNDGACGHWITTWFLSQVGMTHSLLVGEKLSPSFLQVQFPLSSSFLVTLSGLLCEPLSLLLFLVRRIGEVTSLFFPSSTPFHSNSHFLVELLLVFILFIQLILQPSHFLRSCLFPRSFLRCWASHPICFCSPARLQENSLSWLRLVEGWRSNWGGCLGPRLAWLLGLYLVHTGISTWSCLTVASGISGSFTPSCFKAFILSPLMCFRAIYPSSFGHPHQASQVGSSLLLLRFSPFQTSHDAVVFPALFIAMFLISLSISITSLRGEHDDCLWQLSSLPSANTETIKRPPHSF